MGITAFSSIKYGWMLTTLNLKPNVDLFTVIDLNDPQRITYDPSKRQVYFIVTSDGYSEIWKSNIYGKGKYTLQNIYISTYTIYI